ncbi:UDP-glucose dehydrogenase family protein [Mesorhizobium sp. A623]
MKVTIFGSGYVGLVSGACLADVGHSVICVDVDVQRVETLKRGIIPFYEPGLAQIVRNNMDAGRLQFTTDSELAVKHGVLLFIAVGTPSNHDGRADLKYVLAVAKSIGEHMDDYKVVIGKSTVPVGTASLVHDTISQALDARDSSHIFDVCSNPEFLKEGAAIEDFTRAARIVIGAESERAITLMQECYAPYNRNHSKMMVMGIRSAELTKYAANAMLATKISFMNELANISELLEADIDQVRLGIGSDPRIGYDFTYAGAGYGGSCFPKDLRALTGSARDVGYEPELISSVEAVNNRQKRKLFSKLSYALNGNLSGKRIAVWGLAFKPNTDDMREAPSRVLLEELWSAGAIAQAFDPKAMPECRQIYGDRSDLKLCASQEEALIEADALVICTEWNTFRTVDPSVFVKNLAEKVIVDGRNLFDPNNMKCAGIKYLSFGRPSGLIPTFGARG